MRNMCVLVLLWLSPWPVLAAETVSLSQVLREAAVSRPLVQATQAQAQAAQGAVTEARGRLLPRLTFSESFAYTNEPGGSLFIALNQERNVMAAGSTYDLVDPAAQKDFETRLTLEQTLFDREAAFGVQRARRGAEAAAAGAAWSAEEAAFAAFQAYLEVQRASAAQSWVQSTRAEAQEIQRVASERRLSGVGLKADELRARVFLAEAERRQRAADNDLILARRRLALAMGREGGEVEIAAPLTAAQLVSADDAGGVEGRADLVALDKGVAAAALGVAQSRAAYWPRLDASASYGLHDETMPLGSDGSAWAVGAGLRWDLFDGFRRSGSGARARAEQAMAQARRTEAQRHSRFLLEEAQLRAAEARLQLESAQQARAEAAEGQRLLQQRYQAGLVNQVDLLGAQSALDRARFDEVGADSQLLLALGNVRFQSGAFLKTYLPAEEIVQ